MHWHVKHWLVQIMLAQAQLEVFLHNRCVLSTATLAGAHSPALVYTLVGAVFVTMIGITVYHFHTSAMWHRITNRFTRFVVLSRNRTIGMQPHMHDLHEDVSNTVIQLHEPLLDN